MDRGAFAGPNQEEISKLPADWKKAVGFGARARRTSQPAIARARLFYSPLRLCLIQAAGPLQLPCVLALARAPSPEPDTQRRFPVPAQRAATDWAAAALLPSRLPLECREGPLA